MKTLSKRTGSKGGITIPAVLRREMGLEPGDAVDISLTDENEITVKPHVPRCAFCGSDDTVKQVHGKGICKECRRAVEDE